jgi:hypothetical protein
MAVGVLLLEHSTRYPHAPAVSDNEPMIGPGSGPQRKPFVSSWKVQILGIPIGVAWGLLLYFHWHLGFGLVLAVLTPLFAGINFLIFRRGQRRLFDPGSRSHGLTGETLEKTPHLLPSAVPLQSYQWVGAADTPGGMGRFNASYPLGVLELDGQSLTLRVRPAFLARLFGGHPLVVVPDQVEVVFPSRARLRYKAIGIRPLHQPPSYFLTMGSDRASILSAIASAGFPMDWNEHKFSFA